MSVALKCVTREYVRKESVVNRVMVTVEESEKQRSLPLQRRAGEGIGR